ALRAGRRRGEPTHASRCSSAPSRRSPAGGSARSRRSRGRRSDDRRFPGPGPGTRRRRRAGPRPCSLRRRLFELVGDPAIALGLELVDQMGAAFPDDPALVHDVHVTRLHEVQDALVVGDDQHAHLGPGHGVDAIGHDAQRVDVQPGVGLVENRQLGLLEGQLEDLHALLLTAASTVWRKSLSEIGSWPWASRWALSTVRRYLVTVTPGTETGYWNAMNRPMRARSSGAGTVMSWPLKMIWP